MFSSEMVVRLLKYAFWFGVVNEFELLQNIFYEGFLSIGKAFGLEIPTLNGVWNNLIMNVEKVLIIFNSWGDFGFLGKTQTFPQMFLLLIILLILLIVIIRIMLELLVLKIQFYLTTGISLFFASFEVFEKTRSLLGGKILKTAIYSGINIIVIIMIATVIRSALDKVNIENLKSIKELKDGYEEIIRYGIILGLGGFLISDSGKVVMTLNEG